MIGSGSEAGVDRYQRPPPNSSFSRRPSSPAGRAPVLVLACRQVKFPWFPFSGGRRGAVTVSSPAATAGPCPLAAGGVSPRPLWRARRKRRSPGRTRARASDGNLGRQSADNDPDDSGRLSAERRSLSGRGSRRVPGQVPARDSADGIVRKDVRSLRAQCSSSPPEQQQFLPFRPSTRLRIRRKSARRTIALTSNLFSRRMCLSPVTTRSACALTAHSRMRLSG